VLGGQLALLIPISAENQRSDRRDYTGPPRASESAVPLARSQNGDNYEVHVAGLRDRGARKSNQGGMNHGTLAVPSYGGRRY